MTRMKEKISAVQFLIQILIVFICEEYLNWTANEIEIGTAPEENGFTCCPMAMMPCGFVDSKEK